MTDQAPAIFLRGRAAPRRLATLAVTAALLATACGTASSRPSASPPQPRVTPSPTAVASPTPLVADMLAGITVSAADVRAAAEGGNAFAVDLLKQLELSKPGGNFVDSAYSLSTALAMLELGARGATETQIAAVLHNAGVTPVQQAAAWKQFDAQLLATAQRDGISLNVANALWLQQGRPVSASFLDTLATNFSAPSNPLDFRNNARAAADLINRWVSDATHGMIPTVVSADQIQNDAFVLTDAIYFNANWKFQFDAADTSQGPFFRPDGSQVSTALMHEFVTLPVLVGKGVTAVELPYVGGNYVADVVMPTSQPIGDFVGGLTPDALAAIEQKLTSTPKVALTLPKFDIASQGSLIPMLEALGMTNAFMAGSADFSGIDGNNDLYIDFVQQAAHMKVAELGTTAAAATVVGGKGGGPIPGITYVTINHPFLFIIRDVTSGAIIFTAQVSDPTASS